MIKEPNSELLEILIPLQELLESGQSDKALEFIQELISKNKASIKS